MNKLIAVCFTALCLHVPIAQTIPFKEQVESMLNLLEEDLAGIDVDAIRKLDQHLQKVIENLDYGDVSTARLRAGIQSRLEQSFKFSLPEEIGYLKKIDFPLEKETLAGFGGFFKNELLRNITVTGIGSRPSMVFIHIITNNKFTYI
ncbi:hypothetical protein FQA39_LY00868 [Lamprigera yunnana]|nr:hypothetical protein FQA39_LY00868 [Lamprigera yunnana]